MQPPPPPCRSDGFRVYNVRVKSGFSFFLAFFIYFLSFSIRPAAVILHQNLVILRPGRQEGATPTSDPEFARFINLYNRRGCIIGTGIPVDHRKITFLLEIYKHQEETINMVQSMKIK